MHLRFLYASLVAGATALAVLSCSDDGNSGGSTPALDASGPRVDSGGSPDTGIADSAVTDSGAADADADADAPLVGSNANDPGTSCLDVRTRDGGTTDGAYWIKPAGAANAFRAQCDMTNDTGGWTLVANYPLGSTTTPPAWSATGAEGTAFDDVNTAFKLADATINALKTTGYRVRGRASACLNGACTIDNTLYFKPTCTFSSTASSTACSTAYVDSAFTTATPSAGSPSPCAQHRGLIDYTCGVRGGVVTNHDPAHNDAGIFLCVGQLNNDTRACVPRGSERAGVQIWVR